MSNFLTENLIIEGPDCSGKTSLYRNLHKETKFRWNIQDRSQLSMLCYARQYGRDEAPYREGLEKEVSNLNNRIVVLLPNRSEMLRRLAERGDEFQNEESLLKLWGIFCEETEKIEKLSNVLVVRAALDEPTLVKAVLNYLNIIENFGPRRVGNFVKMWVQGSFSNEAVLDLKMSVPIDYSDSLIMSHPGESEYYETIESKCKSIIENEIKGNNPYSTPQTLSSRRFYYSSDTCISSIHFLPRGDKLKVLCTLRSTDVERNAEPDLTFLSHLSAEILRYFSWPCNRIDLTVKFNSAHIRTDLRGK